MITGPWNQLKAMLWNQKKWVISLGRSFWAWEAVWGRMLALDELKRSGLMFPNQCSMRKGEEWSLNHFLLYCSKVRILWLLVYSLFGRAWLMHSLARGNFLIWHGSVLGRRQKRLRGLLFWACFGLHGRREIKHIWKCVTGRSNNQIFLQVYFFRVG